MPAGLAARLLDSDKQEVVRLNRQLTQQEIDHFFEGRSRSGLTQSTERTIQFDFRRPDRIPKSQLRAIHMLHDTFVRNLVSSISAYLRAYVTINLISVEQLSYAEFLECLPSPTCLVSMGLKPYDGNAVLELNPSLAFPILEMLLGGSGQSTLVLSREITEIEQNLLEGFFRIVLQDLKSAWKGVTTIDFTNESMETEPQFLRILAPNEAVVAVSIEIRIGEGTGMMNIAIPSIIVKMMRQKFDQQWSLRKTETAPVRQAQMLQLVKPATMELEARLTGPTLSVMDVLAIQPGQILMFDYAVNRSVSLSVAGVPRYEGRMIMARGKKAFRIDQTHSV